MQACDLKSVVSEHAKDAGHSIDWANVKIIGQENNLLSGKIHKYINIHTWRPEMNRDQGCLWNNFAASSERGCE